MENHRIMTNKTQETPKRSRQSDSESSPTSQKPEKLQKMEFTSEQIQQILQAATQLPALLIEIAELNKINREFRDNQEKMAEQINNIHSRVQNLEDDVSELKQQPPNQVEEQIEELKVQSQQLHQSSLNTTLLLRNFPIEMKTDKTALALALSNTFKILELDIKSEDYEATAIKVRGKELTFIQLRFASEIMKVRVIKKYREMRKSSTDEPTLLMEQITPIPHDHELNGKMLMVQNKLTKHNFDILKAARAIVPSHIEFVYDTPEGKILAKVGDEMRELRSEQDIYVIEQENTATTTANSGISQPQYRRHNSRGKNRGRGRGGNRR